MCWPATNVLADHRDDIELPYHIDNDNCDYRPVGQLEGPSFFRCDNATIYEPTVSDGEITLDLLDKDLWDWDGFAYEDILPDDPFSAIDSRLDVELGSYMSFYRPAAESVVLCVPLDTKLAFLNHSFFSVHVATKEFYPALKNDSRYLNLDIEDFGNFSYLDQDCNVGIENIRVIMFAINKAGGRATSSTSQGATCLRPIVLERTQHPRRKWISST